MIYVQFVSTKLLVKFDWGGTFTSRIECLEELVASLWNWLSYCKSMCCS